MGELKYYILKNETIDYLMEGNIMFGAKVVEPNAIIALKEEISA